jgi:ornithine carbamoyltransferase
MQREDFLGRDFLTLMDFTPEEILYILDVAADFKARHRRREPHDMLRGRTVAMIFEKPSTRTRTSFQAACSHLGIDSFYMQPGELQISRGEPIRDTARVIDRYCDALVIRTFGQEIVEEFAHWMKAPVINALTDLTHPCQGLADLLTIREKKGKLQGLKVCYAGDVWNVCHTLMVCGSLLGFDVTVAAPPGYPPAERIRSFVAQAAARSGATIRVVHDLDEAIRDADVVYANTWHSMGGPEKSKEQRIKDFAPYQINAQKMRLAKPDAIFMHCLPGYRGEEMTDEVIEGPQSVVFDQAENRMHTEKAVLYLTIA